MTPEARTAALKALASCGCTTVPTTDDQIVEAFTTLSAQHAAKDAENAAAKAKLEADLKAAQAAQIPAERLAVLTTLAAKQEAQDAAEKTELVTKLKTASTVLTEAQLNEKPLDELRMLAQFAKIETPDYSGRGVAVPRQAAQADDFTPPNAYEAGLKALQGATK